MDKRFIWLLLGLSACSVNQAGLPSGMGDDGKASRADTAFGLIANGTDADDDADDDAYDDADGDGLTDAEEADYGTDPNNADTDGGGVSDYAELYEFGLNPLDASDDTASTLDTDGDGLIDLYEAYFGTNPNNADTDGGGVSDYQELVNGTNPLVTADDATP